MTAPADHVTTLTLRDTVVATANYAYLPFEVPAGTTRVDVELDADLPAVLGLGVFDARGSGYQSPGFRGISGVERRSFFVAFDAASPGFIPGPLPPGTWTVIVPVFLAALPTRITVHVRLTRGAGGVPVLPGPLPGVVRDAPGWYRGDLHCHTEASSDAYASGSALSPAGYADLARALGLDFLAMTDHNVVSQNWALGRDAGDGVLLLAGEEMTNYFHGHATVAGIDAGDWLDFRQTPEYLPLPTGGERISTFVEAAHAMGGYVSAAHPLQPNMPWQFLADALHDPAARTDALEVWNGPWQVNEEIALRVWDGLLRRGWDIVANGGSDLHGQVNDGGLAVGQPTTVVYATALAREPVVGALRAGRSFVTRAPDGVEVYLTASGPAGQETYVGGRIYGSVGDEVTVRALVRGAGGMRVRLLTQDGEVLDEVLDSDAQELTRVVPIAARGGFIRAEVRGEPTGPLPVPRLDMEAFTNPIRLQVGPVPAGTVPEHAPPGPVQPR